MTETLSTLAPPASGEGNRRSMIRSWMSIRRNSRALPVEKPAEAATQSTPSVIVPQLAPSPAIESPASSSSSIDGEGEPRMSTLNFLKRKSMLGSPSNQAIELPAQEEPKFSIDLEKGPDGYVCHPGGLIRGHIAFADCGPAASDIKTITLRVIGEIRFTHYDMNESVMRRVVRTSRQRFLALPPLKVDRKGIWQTEPDTEKDKERTLVPFELRLPEKCYSIFDPYKSSRNRTTLPPTMHWIAPKKKSGSQPEQEKMRALGNGNPVNDLLCRLKKVAKAEAPEVAVQIRYLLDVHIRWKTSSPFSKTTCAQTDFVVVPKPPVSTSIKHAIPSPSQPPVLDSALALALGATQAIDVQNVRDAVNAQANAENSTAGAASISQSNANDTRNAAAEGPAQEERAGRRRSRAPTIGYQGCRQLASADTIGPHLAPEPQWTKLVMMNTPRGPQAWQIHELKAKEALHNWTLSAELSMPATVAVLMDTPTEFRLSISSNLKGVKVKAVNIRLLRSIASNTSFGKLILESMQEATLDGRPVLEVRDFKSATQTVAPPLDEYADTEGSETAPETFEGTLFIASGWKQSRKEIEDNAHKTLPLKTSEKDEPTSVQRGSLLTTPSFVFRCVTVEYALGVEIVFESEGPSKSRVTAQIETAPIKIASAAGSSSRPTPNPRRNASRVPRQRSRSRLAHARSVSSIRQRASRQPAPSRQRQQRVRSRQTSGSSVLRGSEGAPDASMPGTPVSPGPPMSPFSAHSHDRWGGSDAPPLPSLPMDFLNSQSAPHPAETQDEQADQAESTTTESLDIPETPCTPALRSSRTRSRMGANPPSTAQTRPLQLMPPASSTSTRGRGVAPGASAAVPTNRTVAGQASAASLRTIDGPAPPYCRPYQDV